MSGKRPLLSRSGIYWLEEMEPFRGILLQDVRLRRCHNVQWGTFVVREVPFCEWQVYARRPIPLLLEFFAVGGV